MSQSNVTNEVWGQQADKVRSDLTNLPDYHYQPLLPGEDTRVVRLLPSTNVDDDIVCKIEHIAVGDNINPANIPYEALSYVCGPDHPPRLVKTVDGTKLSIRPNLLDALRLLRSSTDERIIWVDQISIHQQNLEERAMQVRNFGRIFNRAVSVKIVLRDSNPSVAMVAFPFLASLAQGIQDTSLTDKISQSAGEYLDALLDLPPADDSRWKAVIKFLENEWFFRAWTLQELVLAKKAEFLCGQYSLSVGVFMLVASIWTSFQESQHTRNYRLRDGTLVFRRIAYLRSIAKIPPERRGNIPGSSEIGSLLHLLSDLRSLKCSDYRDKIWAIISIATDYDDSTLPVDYQAPWKSVYTKLVETKARNIQGGVDQNRPKGLPSWVPLFHLEPHFLNTMYSPRVIVRSKQHKIYYASGSTQVNSRETTAPETVLKCRGLKIGVIGVLANPAGNLMNAGTGIGERVLQGGEWQALARSSCTPHHIYRPTMESVDLAFERLRAGDLFPNPNRRSREGPPSNLPQPSNYAFATVEPGSDNKFIDGDVNDIGRSILCATTRRRMFITDTGYMGLTHRSNVMGDEIWVLMGADMPVTLHPASTETLDQPLSNPISPKLRTFEFRGESYVHGVMDGEALIDARRREDANCPEDTKWLDDLGQEPWPFSTEEIALI
ncbi:hypothetical protein LTS15_001859 [Exophiala xenobiotica]|nr:hypothetical protein LTS15_001859 [Exophiala xenobiotica]